MRLKAVPDFSNLKPEDLGRYLTLFAQNLTRVINGNLNISENHQGKVIECEFQSTNTDHSFQHNLNYVPEHYIIIKRSKAMYVWDGDDEFTDNTIVLQSNNTGTAKILVF